MTGRERMRKILLSGYPVLSTIICLCCFKMLPGVDKSFGGEIEMRSRAPS